MIISAKDLRSTLSKVFRNHGMAEQQALSAAGIFIDAELAGRSSHGAFHALNYLGSLQDGSINPIAEPQLSQRGVVIRIDADQGLAQYAIEQHLDRIIETVRQQGVASLSVFNTFTTGELGWYPRLFSRHGVISTTTTNSPALVALGSTGERTVGTNPFAVGIPGVMQVDQAISHSAFHTVRQHAARGEEIPPHWAVDKEGNPTQDPNIAISEGALTPFGGHRGANIALINELLAMLAGGLSSLQASTNHGSSPQVGLFSTLYDPEFFGSDSLERLKDTADTLSAKGIYIPGQKGDVDPAALDIDDATWHKLSTLATA